MQIRFGTHSPNKLLSGRRWSSGAAGYAGMDTIPVPQSIIGWVGALG